MMPSFSGRRVPLSLPRRWIDDLMRISRGRSIITFERRMALASVAAARKNAPISWPLLFAKAFAIVAARRPELRRAYIRYPWPHLYEAELTITSLAIEREYCGEMGVFFALIREPDRQPLAKLQQYLESWKRDPVESVLDFRRLIRYSKMPLPFRRICWWYGANVSGYDRARNFGTTGISVTAAAGATALNLISPVATTLNYGLFDAEHNVDVRLHVDHRAFDGMTAARLLAEIETALTEDVANELISMNG